MDRRNFLQRGITAATLTTAFGSAAASTNHDVALPASLQQTFKMNYAPHDGMF